MDVLAGYGSSSSDDCDEVERNVTSLNITIAPVSKLLATTSAPLEHRGKKILSLASVLPPHILRQLTRIDQVDSSDDDDDGNNRMTKERTNGATKPQSYLSFTSDAGQQARDPEISLLLSDLMKNRPDHTGTMQPSCTKLGEAFVTSDITKASIKKDFVRNIHEESTSVSSPPGSRTKSVVTQQNDFFQKREAKDLCHSEISEIAISTSRRLDAAPSVAVSSSVVVAAPISVPRQPVEQIQPQKRSRKEMEHFLRQGKLEQVLKEGGLSKIQAADPNAFTPDYAPPVEAGTVVRNVPTQMYDPSIGSTVTMKQMGGKGSGKNQINHLLSQAANLEQQRQQQSASNATAKMHRVNAKRKYGW